MVVIFRPFRVFRRSWEHLRGWISKDSNIETPVKTKIKFLSTVQSQFSDILFSDKSQFSDNCAEDLFLVHKNVSFSDNLVFFATPIY